MVDSEVSADGGDPAAVKRVTIGFNAISSLAAGKVDAATGFWNAEGVTLQRQGVPIRIFKVNQYGAPPYPELVLTTTRETIERDPGLVRSMVEATRRGYEFAVATPEQGLDDLLAEVPSLERADQRAQLARSCRISIRIRSIRPCCGNGLRGIWKHGLLERPLDVGAAFAEP